MRIAALLLALLLVAPSALLEESDGLPPHVVPVLLTALYCALTVPTDFRGALSRVLPCGGEVDSAAALTGALLGARLGCDGIPARLRKNVLYADHLVASADRLFVARQESVRAPALEKVLQRRRR